MKYASFLILTCLVFTFSACTGDETKTGYLDQVEVDEDFVPTRFEEKERKTLLKSEIEADSFLKACDNFIVQNYDIDQCVFEVQNETEEQADCVVLCGVAVE